MSEELYDIIILGGGPAGYSAGIYAARGRLKTLLVENFASPSQVILTDHIENYPGFPEGVNGFDLIEKFKNQAKKFDIDTKSGEAEKIEEINNEGRRVWEITISGNTYRTLSVVIGTGAAARKIGVPGEEEFRGKGVSYCAVCDAAFFKDMETVVVGGGDTAVQEAVYLAKFCKKVTLIHRRDRLRAEKLLQERAFSNEKIDYKWNSVITGIKGKEKVDSVTIKNKKTEETEDFKCNGIFIFIGYTPNTGFIKDTVELDDAGWVKADMKMKTNAPGIFAAGDCRADVYRQIVTAAGDGATAALSAEHYIERLKGTEYK